MTESSVRRQDPSKPRDYDDPYIALSMSILEQAIKDYIYGLEKCLSIFGYLPKNPRCIELGFLDSKKGKKSGWLKDYIESDRFIGSDWYFSLVEELDPIKLRRMCINEAYDRYLGKDKEDDNSKSGSRRCSYI